ncbi:MAG: MarR family transcriptional regulator [Gemmatimonadaceae bacterium]|nr:MarR family transcriptional regulator [Gemmatimonadaceae bacterium]
MQLLAAYRGLPLTADDVADELGVTRRTVQDVAGKLIREGRITRTTAEDKRTALYRAVAMEAAA